MNMENRRVRKAETIPWYAIEEKYDRLLFFVGEKGTEWKNDFFINL